MLNLWVPPDFHLFSFFEDEMGKKFSCVFVLILAMKEPDQEQFVCTNETSHCNSLYTQQLAVNFM